jgi:hypothetical protein
MSSPSPICSLPVSVLWVGLQRSKITKLGCEKKSLQGHILMRTAADALSYMQTIAYIIIPFLVLCKLVNVGYLEMFL